MTVEKRFKERYKSGDTPWDAGQPDFNLIETSKPTQGLVVPDAETVGTTSASIRIKVIGDR